MNALACIRALDEPEVPVESDLNLHIEIVVANQDMAGNLLLDVAGNVSP